MLPQILLLTPFRNEDASIPLYLEGLRNLDYPKELVDAYWLENDSSDQTLEMLKEAQPTMPFKSCILEYVKILGPVKKQPAGIYWKDIPYETPERVKPWLTIWNQYFLPRIAVSEASYCLMWMADCVPPSKVVLEYLKVFQDYSDAGWVGGAHHRRHPEEAKIQSPVGIAANVQRPTRCLYTGHCWLMRTDAFKPKVELGEWQGDIHTGLVKTLKDNGFYVYYQPTVYIKHVSTDGKIYCHSL